MTVLVQDMRGRKFWFASEVRAIIFQPGKNGGRAYIFEDFGCRVLLGGCDAIVDQAWSCICVGVVKDVLSVLLCWYCVIMKRVRSGGGVTRWLRVSRMGRRRG